MIFLDCIVKILVSAAEDKDGSRGEDEERSSRVRGVKNFGKWRAESAGQRRTRVQILITPPTACSARPSIALGYEHRDLPGAGRRTETQNA